MILPIGEKSKKYESVNELKRAKGPVKLYGSCITEWQAYRCQLLLAKVEDVKKIFFFSTFIFSKHHFFPVSLNTSEHWKLYRGLFWVASIFKRLSPLALIESSFARSSLASRDYSIQLNSFQFNLFFTNH